MEFEWDSRKDRENNVKHGISFDEAKGIFDGHYHFDSDGNGGHGEDRYIAIGYLKNGKCVIVAYTHRGDRTRIISARKASGKERKLYDEYLTFPV